MTEEEADRAHEISELYQELIVKTGAVLLADLTEEQRDYVIYKASNEFRFWRVEDEFLK